MLRRNVPHRTVGKMLGLSKTTVTRLAGTARAPVQRTAPRAATVVCKPAQGQVVPVVEADPEPVDARRAELLAAIFGAETDIAFADAEVALLRHDDPDFDGYLQRGCTLFDALSSSDNGEFYCLRRPADLAEMVLALTATPGGCERKPRQSKASFAAEQLARADADRARAVELVTEILAIVKAAPIAARYQVKS